MSDTIHCSGCFRHLSSACFTLNGKTATGRKRCDTCMKRIELRKQQPSRSKAHGATKNLRHNLSEYMRRVIPRADLASAPWSTDTDPTSPAPERPSVHQERIPSLGGSGVRKIPFEVVQFARSLNEVDQLPPAKIVERIRQKFKVTVAVGSLQHWLDYTNRAHA